MSEGNGKPIPGGSHKATFKVKAGLAEMLKGGVIMDVVTAEHARIAQEAGACAVMALERVPADIRRDGGVARMSDPRLIKEIQAAVTIPVMAKARIGHFVDAQLLEALGTDYIDEPEALTPAAEDNHVRHPDCHAPFARCRPAPACDTASPPFGRPLNSVTLLLTRCRCGRSSGT